MEQISISIFGATGSIGTQALDIIDQLSNKINYKINLLTANNDYKKLVELAKKHRPEYIAICDDSNIDYIKENINFAQIIYGKEAMQEASKISSDVCIAAISGIDGLKPILNSIKYCSKLAIANKEAIICSGSLLFAYAKKHNCEILPIDSEHNAIFQLLNFEKRELFEKIILTGSGGPFLHLDKNDLENVTIENALNHPNWKMGPKISIDSATMANKAFELVECLHLFDVTQNQVEINIHPQSIVHSMVCLKDGAIIAHLGDQDMRIPISYCLSYPNRFQLKLKAFNLADVGKLEFFPEDQNKFPMLKIMREAIDFDILFGPISFNIANDLAVSLFLQNELRFTKLSEFVAKYCEYIFAKNQNINIKNFDDIFEVIDHGNKEAKKLLYQFA